MSKTIDWISASDALDAVETRLGGRAAAKATLADMMRDHKLTAQAAMSWTCDVRDVDIAWEGRNESYGEWDVDVIIDEDMWRDSIQWSDDLELWRWPESFFLVTHSKRPFERSYFEGVSFPRDVIHQVLLGRDMPVASKSKGGRRPDLQRWEAFWMEVVQIAREGNLVPGQIASQAALREDLLDAMKGNPLSEDSIKEPVRRIWERFFER